MFSLDNFFCCFEKVASIWDYSNRTLNEFLHQPLSALNVIPNTNSIVKYICNCQKLSKSMIVILAQRKFLEAS